MKPAQNPPIRLVLSMGTAIAAWTTALGVMSAPIAQAACILTIPPADSEESERHLKDDGVLELAGGPEQPLSCSQSPYLRSTGGLPSSRPMIKTSRAHATTHRSHSHTRSRMRNLHIARSFGFRYPGFMRVYSTKRVTSPVRTYSAGRYAGSTKTYSGPRFTNTGPVPHPRYTGFSPTYRSHRYTGFSHPYAGPRYSGNIASPRR